MDEVLLKKLRYKAGPAAILNPPEGYDLGIEKEEQLTGIYEFVQLFVQTREINRMAAESNQKFK